jgi:hypothetical protein
MAQWPSLLLMVVLVGTVAPRPTLRDRGRAVGSALLDALVVVEKPSSNDEGTGRRRQTESTPAPAPLSQLRCVDASDRLRRMLLADCGDFTDITIALFDAADASDIATAAIGGFCSNECQYTLASIESEYADCFAADAMATYNVLRSMCALESDGVTTCAATVKTLRRVDCRTFSLPRSNDVSTQCNEGPRDLCTWVNDVGCLPTPAPAFLSNLCGACLNRYVALLGLYDQLGFPDLTFETALGTAASPTLHALDVFGTDDIVAMQQLMCSTPYAGSGAGGFCLPTVTANANTPLNQLLFPTSVGVVGVQPEATFCLASETRGCTRTLAAGLSYLARRSADFARKQCLRTGLGAGACDGAWDATMSAATGRLTTPLLFSCRPATVITSATTPTASTWCAGVVRGVVSSCAELQDPNVWNCTETCAASLVDMAGANVGCCTREAQLAFGTTVYNSALQPIGFTVNVTTPAAPTWATNPIRRPVTVCNSVIMSVALTAFQQAAATCPSTPPPLRGSPMSVELAGLRWSALEGNSTWRSSVQIRVVRDVARTVGIATSDLVDIQIGPSAANSVVSYSDPSTTEPAVQLNLTMRGRFEADVIASMTALVSVAADRTIRYAETAAFLADTCPATCVGRVPGSSEEPRRALFSAWLAGASINGFVEIPVVPPPPPALTGAVGPAQSFGLVAVLSAVLCAVTSY